MKFTDFLKIQENKDHFIDKNDNLDSEQKELAKDFLKSHQESEKKLDWNKSNSLTWKDFEQIFDDSNNTKSAIKKATKENKKLLFEKRNDCKVVGENDKFIFVLPLSYKACVWMDSFDCGGAGAKWCIGDKTTKEAYDEYNEFHTAFVLAFNKYPEDIESDLKYMIEIDDDNSGKAWMQKNEIDTTYEISDSDGRTVQKLTGLSTQQLIDFKNEYWKFLNEYIKDSTEKIKRYEYTETTWKNLKNTIDTANSSLKIKITDHENVVLGDSEMTGNLGYIIRNCMGEYLVDFTPSDFSTAQYTAGSTNLFKSCTNLSGMCKLPSSITNTGYMFTGCTNLTSIDTSTFTKVTSAYCMFANCTCLTSIDTTGFTNVTDASGMFQYCTGLKSIDTSAFINVSDASDMFDGCTKLTSIDASIFTKVTHADGMFYNCTSLTSIDTSGFTKVTKANGMFQKCTGLTNIDTSAFTKVTIATNMFSGCTGLTSIDTSAFTNVTYAESMFSGCTNLTSITKSGFINVNIANNMFSGCTKLANIDMSAFKNVKDSEDMFYGCDSIDKSSLSFETLEKFF